MSYTIPISIVSRWFFTMRMHVLNQLHFSPRKGGKWAVCSRNQIAYYLSCSEMGSIVTIKFGNNSSQFYCSSFVLSNFCPLSFPAVPWILCAKASVLKEVCTLLPTFPHIPLPPRSWQIPSCSVSKSLTFPLSRRSVAESALRYLALHCPLVLSSELTPPRPVKTPHCLPPT